MNTLSYRNYLNNMNWAYRAREKFIESLQDKSISDLYLKNNSGEVNVSVYGKSQVGKTTLILKLIGIKEEEINNLGKILRGGRSIGNSSTSTAMIYGTSYDDFFYYKESDLLEEKLDKEGLIEKLKNLRNKVENNEIMNIETIKILIPIKYYDMSKRRISINIIDLPGIGSSEIKEYNHVEKLVKRFIPISNLVILIDRADQLSRLKNLKIPGIDDWRNYIDRFRIVLTSSVSCNSTIKILEKKESLEEEEYIELFTKYIIKDVMQDFNKNYLFPLEYGLSWKVMKEKYIDITNKVEPIMDNLYLKLINDIEESQNEYNLFMLDSKMYINVKRKIDEKIENMNSKIKLIENEYKNIEIYIKFLENYRTIESNRNKIYKNNIRNINSINVIPNLDVNYKDNNDIKNDKTFRKVKGMKLYLENLSEELYTKIKSEIIRIENLFFNFGFKSNSKKNYWIEIQDEINYMKKKLDENLLNRYYINKKMYYDLDKVNKFIEDLKISCMIKISKEFDEFRKYYIKELNSKIKENNKLNDTYIDIIEYKKKELFNLSKKINSIKCEKNVYIEKSNKDYRTAKRFLEFIDRAFSEEYNFIIQKINNKDVEAINKVHLLLYIIDISIIYKKIKNSI